MEGSTANKDGVSDRGKQPKRSTVTIALGTMLSASAAPYGYTVSLWSCGAVLIRSRSTPSVGEVFLFAAGALCGFTLLGILARRLEAPGLSGADRERVITGALHWFAVGVAVGAAALIAQIPSWVAWPLASFAVTTLYLVAASLQFALVAHKPSDAGRGGAH